MDSLLSNLVKKLEPYIPGEQPAVSKLIKLNTNENPYPPSPEAIKAMQQAVGGGLRLYSKPECEDLRHAIAEAEGLPGIEYVYPSNGSDEVLAFAFQAFFNPGEKILFPNITYSFYPVYCSLYGLDYECIPVKEDFRLDVELYNRKNGGIVIANPNAPTGLCIGLDQIKRLLEYGRDRVVVVDEAYIEFGAESALPLIHEYPNLVIIRTMSKSHSLAGLRVGYAMAQPHLVSAIISIKNSFNSYTLDSVAQAGAAAAMKDKNYMRANCLRVMKTREWAKAEFRERGFTATDSMTNFLFVKPPGISAGELFERLRHAGILVRYFKNSPLVNEWLRISVGSDKDMEELFKQIDIIL